LKAGQIVLRADDFPADICGGLESDLVLEPPTYGSKRKWCVAIANNSRPPKAESEKFRLKLEELTGLTWRHDEISKFVFHLELTKKKGRRKMGKKQKTKKRPTSNAQHPTSNMEVVFNREALLEALKLASLAAAKSGPKYILKHVLIRAAMDIVNIRATDNEVGLDIQVVQSETKAEGYVALPAAEFTKAVAECEDETVTLKQGDKSIQLITSDGRYEFCLVDVNEFPTIRFGFDEIKGCELNLKKLQEAIGRVIYAAAKWSTRYALNGVLWEPVAGGLNLVATDGRRLAKTSLKTEVRGQRTEVRGQRSEDRGGNRVVISKKTMEILSHLPGDHRKASTSGDNTTVRIEIAESNFFAATDTTYLCGIVLAGQFPKYEDIIPAGCAHSIALDAAATAKQVRRAKILECDEENMRNITISSADGTLLFDAENVEIGKAEMTLKLAEGEKNGSGDFQIDVRSKYLLEALKTFGSAAGGRGKFRLEVTGADKPLVLRDDPSPQGSDAASETVHVIMPVKT